MVDFTIRVVVDPRQAVRGTRQVRSELQRTETTGQQLRRTLRNVFAVVGIAATIRQLTSLADAYTTIQNRLRTVVPNQAQLGTVTEQLFEVSNRTRSSFAATAEVYARVGLAARDLGVSQRELIQFTESLNQAVILSGASAVEAQAGLIQLSQGLASGALRGDELRSVLEQLPTVADVIAQSLGVTRGQLRDLGAEGAITADIVLTAFEQAADSLDEQFGRTIPTISQAFQVLNNEIVRFVGNADTASGTSALLAISIQNIAQNLENFVNAAAALAAVFGARFLAPLISQFATATIAQANFAASVSRGNTVLINSAQAARQRAIQTAQTTASEVASTAATVSNTQATIAQLRVNLQTIQSQRAEAAANVELQRGIALTTGRRQQLTAALAAQNSSTRALIVTRRALRIAETELTAATSANTAATSANTAAQTALAAATARTTIAFRVLTGVAAAFRSALALVGGPLGAIILGFTALAAGVSRFISDIESIEDAATSFNESIQGVGFTIDSINDDLRSISGVEAIVNLGTDSEQAAGFVDQLSSSLEVLAERRRDAAIAQLEAERETILAERRRLEQEVQGLTRGATGFGVDVVATLTGAPGTEDFRGLLGRIEQQFNPAIEQINSAITDLNRLTLDELTSEAERLGAELTGGAESANTALESISNLERQVLIASQATEQARVRFEALLSAGLDPTADASTQLGQRITTLVDRLRELSAAEEASRDLERFQQSVDSTIIGLQQSIAVLGTERGVERDVLQTLISAGIEPTNEAYREQIEVITNLVSTRNSLRQAERGELRDQREREFLLRTITGRFDELTRQQELLSELYRDGAISGQQFNEVQREITAALAQFDNTVRGGLIAGLAEVSLTLNDLGRDVSDVVVSAFDRASTALVNFVETGRFSIRGFVADTLSELARLAANRTFSLLAQGGLNFLGGGGSGFLGGLFGGLPGFQFGGSFPVNAQNSIGTVSGVDNRVVAFRARDGETVTVNRPGESMQPRNETNINVQFTVNAADADSFRRSQGQILADLQRTITRASQRNN